MKKKLSLIIALSFAVHFSYGQIVDRYGINIGSSYSTQIWDYKLIPVDSDKDYKFGLMAFIHAEKDFGNILALRTEFGYIQKGFKNKFELPFGDGTSAGVANDNVVLHDLALNIGLKVNPLKIDYSPYLLAGFRGDYMISYKDIIMEEQASGLEFNLYQTQIEQFNKLNIGGLLVFGLDIKELLYLEIEYNPIFTNNFNDNSLRIKDNCWGVKLGLNINKLTE